MADRWADKCLALETALAAEQAKRGIAPGAPVLGGPEEGLVSYAGLAPTGPNLDRIVARMIGPPIPAAPESPKEPRKLTYPEVVAMQRLKSIPVIPEATRELARRLTGATRWWSKQPIKPLCHHSDGRPAITTAEITQRAQEIVDAREAQKHAKGMELTP